MPALQRDAPPPAQQPRPDRASARPKPGRLRAARSTIDGTSGRPGHPTAGIRTPDSFQNPCLSFTPHTSFASVSPPLNFQSKPLCSVKMDPDSQALDQETWLPQHFFNP